MSTSDLFKVKKKPLNQNQNQNQNFDGSASRAISGELLPPPPVREEGTVSSFFTGVQEGFKNIGQEAEKIGTGFLEKNFYVDPGTTQALSDKINAEREEFRNSPVGSSTAGKVGQFTGEILPTIVIPGGIVGGVTRRMVTGAAAGGIGGIAAPTDSPEFWNEQRVVNTVVNTTLGTSGPLAISGVKYTGNKLGEITKGFRPSTVLKDVSGSVTRSDTKGAIQSATNLNTFLTPAEATGFGELVVRESSLRLDDPALQSLGVAVRGREATLKQSINDLLEEIAPNTPERATLISEGYEALARTKMTPKLLENIANDKTLGPYYTTFLKAKGYKESIADVPENSLSRLDHFNEFLNEKTKTFYKAGKNRAGKVVNDKRKELQNFVDQAVPEYAVARRVAQLDIIKKNIIKEMSKIKGSGVLDDAGRPVPDAIQFYQKFLKSGETYENLIINLSDNPNALQKISDLRTVLSAIESSPLKKLFKPAPGAVEGLRTVGQAEAGLALTESLRIGKGAYSKAMLELITDPAWDSKILENAAELAAKQKKSATRVRVVEEFAKVINRVIAKDSTSRQSSEPEPEYAPR